MDTRLIVFGLCVFGAVALLVWGIYSSVHNVKG